MGHRALHAVPTGDGYDCVRTRWGGLAVFDGEFPDPPEARRRVARRVDAAGVLSALGPADEALFVHGEGVTYLVRRLDVPTVVDVLDGTRATTALIPVTDAGTARQLDCELRTAKEVLGDAVDAGLLLPELAEGYLRAFLAHRSGAQGAIWVPPP